MNPSTKCRSSKGPEHCTDPQCPEKQAYTAILETLNSNSLDYNKYETLQGQKKAMEKHNPRFLLPSHIKVEENTSRKYTLGSIPGNNSHKFYYGELTDDKDLAALHEADPKKAYQLGDCGDLASNLWHLHNEVDDIFIMKTDDEPEFGVHIFAKLKNGNFVDSLGIWSEKTLLTEWHKYYPEGTIERIEDVEDEPIKKDPNTKPANLALYNAVETAIANHLNKETEHRTSSKANSLKQKIYRLFR